ncbi:MAG: PilW family protein [gamma proteobacterium symbiont of Lucinoma myriamae]|nr:PilW family protein [gamma proteobacterium symbiont of Lucinoma myriamae]MCU7817492.1 PilW family protein [gamma proteobacterium symbiont of Lucinoma myriamae]MCU7831069.1 PilW family protein [gamma proteobacterium symbiont of Lucinoma myriamae]
MFHYDRCSHQRQKGFTLVEMMVAVLISMLLLGGIIQIFLSNKQTYRTLETLSHVQESGRFAMEFLNKDIRMADFWGCQTDSSNIRTHVDFTTTDVVYNDWNSGGLIGADNNSDASDDIIDGTDSVTLRGAFGSGVFVVQVPATPAAALKVSDSNGLIDGDLVVLTDCEMGEFFVITDTTGPSGFDNIGHNEGNNSCSSPCTYSGNASSTALAQNSSKTFQKIYGEDATIMKYGEITYNIKTGASGEPALFKSFNGLSLELVSGIEDMQIFYGVDSGPDGNVDYYADASSITGATWDDVVTVRVTLSVRSPNQKVVIDQAGASSDNRLRKTFTGTIAVRNRLN